MVSSVLKSMGSLLAAMAGGLLLRASFVVCFAVAVAVADVVVVVVAVYDSVVVIFCFTIVSGRAWACIQLLVQHTHAHTRRNALL